MPFQKGHKLVVGNTWNRGRKQSLETRRKRIESRSWYKHSEETKRKLSNAHKGRKKPSPSNETRKKLSEALKGEKSYLWKGGISKHPSYKSFIERRREVRKKGNGGSHTLDEWETLKAQYNWTCPCCKKQELEIKLTEDHIIPISRGGSDNIENIQPLCKLCNSIKRTKIVKYSIDILG